jgi:transposase
MYSAFMRAQIPHLSSEEQQHLRSVVRSSKSARRDIFRARIILDAAEGQSNEAIAAARHTRAATVSKWRTRFLRHRLAGLLDAPRSGKPADYDATTERRILQQLDALPPPGYARWNGRLLSRALGNVSRHHVWRVLRRHGISLQRRRSWCVSTDPCFAQKAADVVGLYLHPPENALVLSVDEKPHIQALERAQGWLRLPNGRALTGFAHDYKRHGTSTLFTALDVASGLVRAGHYRRRRRVEFLDFMNRLVTAYPQRTLHVILDNLNIHKPKCDRWRQRHPQVHFHYTPTHASWLNQVEIWFSLLSRQALRTASFQSTEQLRAHIDAFIAAYNETAHPFDWTKQVAFQKHPKSSYANL